MRSPSSSKLPFFVFLFFSSSLLFWGAPLPLSVAIDHADLTAGNVVTLTQDNFREHVEDGNTWLVDFYAPWCGHCVRLNPVLDEVAAAVGDKLRIGKVDATIHTRLAKQFGISGYPSLKIFQPPSKEGEEVAGSVSNYDGARTPEALTTLAVRLSAPALAHLPTPEALAGFLRSLQNASVGFVLGRVGEGGRAGRGEDGTEEGREGEEQVFEQVARALKVKASFGSVGKEALEKGKGRDLFSAPTLSRAGYFLAKVEGGKAGEPNAPIFFPAQPSSSLSLTRVADVTTWVLKHNHPRMSALSGHNFRQLGMLGKLLLVAAIDPSGDPAAAEAFLDLLDRATRRPSLQPLFQDHYVLGWLDARRWEGFVKNFGIGKDNLPSFFVLDFPSQKHWVLEAKGGLRVWAAQEVAEDTLAAFLVDVVEGKVPAKQPGLLGGMPAAIWTRVVDLWPWSLALLLPLGWIFAACLGGIAVVDKEEEELRGEGEGERPVGDAGEDDRLGAGKAAVSKKED